jgi:hypothetical protein
MCYFVNDTLALAEQKYFHHPKTWCCPMPQKFGPIQNTSYKVLTKSMMINATVMETEM